MDFGPVTVSNVSIKDKLLVTQRDLVTRLLKLLQTAPKDAMAAISKRYKELQVQYSCRMQPSLNPTSSFTPSYPYRSALNRPGSLCGTSTSVCRNRVSQNKVITTGL